MLMTTKCFLLKIYLLIGLSILSNSAFAQIITAARKQFVLKNDWQFAKDEADKGAEAIPSNLWKAVDIPHTWNATDVMDDEAGYYRGIGLYKKTILANPSWKDKQVWLCFDGVNQEAEIYLNSEKIGKHIGGYTGFKINLSPYLRYAKDQTNTLVIKVNNRHNKDVPPLSADFTFYGGIYRDVYLQILAPLHFDDAIFGSTGLLVSTPTVSHVKSTVHIKGTIANRSGMLKPINVITKIFDEEGTVVSKVSTALRLSAQEDSCAFEQLSSPIVKPNLWTPERPYRYKAITTIVDQDGHTIDQLVNTVGFRWFSFDPDRGFYLNGKPYKLIGASRHQDYKGLGNAVPDVLQVHDLQLLKDMGGNFLRIAHYPQSPAILRACDSLGILASVEIPIVNEITTSKAFFSNSLFMQQEMIRQNFNHPSVIIWGYMNEVLLRPHFIKDKQQQETYFKEIKKLAQALEDLTRKEDTSRYTMIANHGNFDLYHRVGLTAIPMLVGWNLYPGWYGGAISAFGTQLDNIHKKLPNKPLMVTEYGADADERVHSFSPERFDKSVEYALMYHQGYIHDFMRRPFVAGVAAWNLADFNSESREESMPHINTKGLLTWDRKPKNTYFLYQAYFRKDPYVKIGTGMWAGRAGVALKDKPYSMQPLMVFSNADTVELFLNGTNLGKMGVQQRCATWAVPFVNGANRLQAVAYLGNEKRVIDEDMINFTLVPHPLRQSDVAFTGLNISVGDNRYLRDAVGTTWIPDQAYIAGSWGAVGGTDFRLKNSSQKNLGADKNIRGTDDDPIFQTQRVGLTAYQLDVAPGTYELTLCFAELLGGADEEDLPYNLGSKQQKKTQVKVRIFDVVVNGCLFLENFNITKQYGAAVAIKKKTTVTVTDQHGIRIAFKAKVGEAVLNGLQLRML